MQLSLSRITFRHKNAIEPLFDTVSATFPIGWTGIIGANGTGKTTLLMLVCGELEPETGHIHRPGRIIYCPQRTDDAPELFRDFMSAIDGYACELRGKLKINNGWIGRWDTLSHGERKRVQIAVALWQEPDVLAIDEPTNHIDADARSLLITALKTFDGIGLLVSHDRELLDMLCGQCLLIESRKAVMRNGGYTKVTSQIKEEDDKQREEYVQVKHSAERLAKEVSRRKDEADVKRQNRKRSKRALSARDSDARRTLDVVIVSGADGSAGRIASQLEGRAKQLKSKLDEFKIERKYDLNFWIPGSCSERKTLFHFPGCSIGLGDGRVLLVPELSMLRDDRIAITGANGTGKSTLIRQIVDNLTLPKDKIIYLPQEVDVQTSQKIMAEVNSLSREQLGQVMTIVSCLGSRPGRLVGNNNASPGEIRKVMLALGIIQAPHLIIMDEPTNHLDLPAIDCLEQALDGCPCGLLLVSHDFRFLSRLARGRWHLDTDSIRNIYLKITDMGLHQ